MKILFILIAGFFDVPVNFVAEMSASLTSPQPQPRPQGPAHNFYLNYQKREALSPSRTEVHKQWSEGQIQSTTCLCQ